MKNFANMTMDECEYVVKTFCELHESGEYTVRQIAEKLDISKEHAGMLSSLLHMSAGTYTMKNEKKKRFSKRRRVLVE